MTVRNNSCHTNSPALVAKRLSLALVAVFAGSPMLSCPLPDDVGEYWERSCVSFLRPPVTQCRYTRTLVSSPASSSKSGNTQSHVTTSAVTTSHNLQSLLHAACCMYMVTNFTPFMSCGLATEEWGERDRKWVSVVSDLISLIAVRQYDWPLS